MNVSRAPITIGIIVTFMFYSFFSSWARSKYLSLFLLSFNFTLRSAGTSKSIILLVINFFVVVDYYRSGRLVEIRWSVCDLFQNLRGVHVCYSQGQMLNCAYTNFLHNSQWITQPTQTCLFLYSFCANLLHSLIIINLHLPFSCVLSILILIWLVLMELFGAAIKRDSLFFS